MQYYLQPALLSPPPAVEITENEYMLLKRSSAALNAAFSLEENYDLLIGNYLELEKTALAISATAVARQMSEYHEFFELRAEMNRRAVNLLSSARLFVDQLPQKIKACGGKASEAKELLSAEYDANFEFRFMEALRNHVQHTGSAVHSMSIRDKWVPPGKSIRHEYATEASVLRRFLELDGSFKRAILDECPDKIDLLPAARIYLECLGSVQESVRKSLQTKILEARQSFDAAISKYAGIAQASTMGLAGHSKGTDAAPIPIFNDWDEVRIKLSKRNCSLKNLSKSVITTTTS